MKKNKKPQEVEQPTVYCCNCIHFQRDTEGISRNLETGEYFMGQCKQGLHPDTIKKQFANKPRKCNKYKFKG